MTALTPWSYGGVEVRTITEGADVYFVASDVAAILGYGHTPHMTRSVEAKDRAVAEAHALSPRAAAWDHMASTPAATCTAGSGLVTLTVRPFGDPSPGPCPERRRGVALVTTWPHDEPVVHVVDSGDVVVLHGRFESVTEFRDWLGLVLEVTESM